MPYRIGPKRAVVVLASLAILALISTTAVLLWGMRGRELAHAEMETANLARMLVEQTQQAFNAADQAVRAAQERLQTSYGGQFELDSLPVHLLLNARISGLRQVSSLFIVGMDGKVLNTSREHPVRELNANGREYFKAFQVAAPPERFIGAPVRNMLDRSWVMHLARPLRGADGRMRGVLVSAVNLDYFESLYSFMKFDFVRPISLYLDTGILLASLPHRDNAVGMVAPELPERPFAMGDGEVRTLRRIDADGNPEYFALARVPRLPMLVRVADDVPQTLASWRESAVPIALGAFLVSIMIAAAAGLLTRELEREADLSRALREADDRYQRTLSSVMDAIVAVDEEQRVVIFNPAAERMFGVSGEDAIGHTLERFIPAEARLDHAARLTEFSRTGAQPRPMGPGVELTGLRSDGSAFPIESTISRTLVDGKVQLTAVLRDVTQRRRAEGELREMNRQLRELSGSLQSVREEERTRISRELHDELGQQLTGLKLDLAWLDGRLKEGREVELDKVDLMRRNLDGTIAAVRRISAELRPRILDDLGLAEAVSWLAGEYAARSGLDIDLFMPAAARVTCDALATALFRVVQESLTNVVRHSGAARARISFVEADGCYVLTVEDDGRGFAPRPDRRGIGTLSMRERALALGGTCEIGPGAAGGTQVRFSVPVDAHQGVDE